MRLEVAMHDACLVRGVQPSGHLLDQRKRLSDVHATPGKPCGERLAGEQLHGEMDELAVDDDIVEPAHVGVGHLAGEVHFATEPLDRLRILRVRTDRLQCDRNIQHAVVRLVHLAHAAAREKTDDGVAIGDDTPVGKRPAGVRELAGSRLAGIGKGVVTRRHPAIISFFARTHEDADATCGSVPLVGPPWARLVAMLALFVALTVVGIWWAAPDGDALAESWRAFARLPLGTHLVLALLSAGVVGAEMLRFVLIGRALGVRISLKAAFDATVANNFFSWVTPGAALGDPAAIYMLGLHGVPWDAAVIISFGKLATGFAFIMGIACVLIALGLGPPISAWAVIPFTTAIALLSAIMMALLAGAYRPEATTALVDRLEKRLARWFRGPRGARAVVALAHGARQAIQRLAGFRRGGARGSLAVLASHVLYYALFVGVLVLLATQLGTPRIDRLLPIAIVYQCFLYVAPTPGGSGIGEASANLFFGGLLPGGTAFVVVMLFRTLTFYLQVVLGLVYLPIRGVMLAILAQARRR